jgi:acyl carrier protein phosphodiesterase
LNYLAHAYLSFQHPEILVGNMISDFIKGKKKFDYPAGIQNGIMLHRLIDNFTDTHEATKKAKEVFRPAYRLYSGALVDVLYDHFLATDPAEFTEKSLLDFSGQVYVELDRYTGWLPEQFARMLPYMKQHNWLFNYRTRQGIQKSLGGVVRRSLHLTESETAFRLFEENYQQLQEYYLHFWKDLKFFAFKEYNRLLMPPPTEIIAG